MMSTESVANELIRMCREGKNMEAVEQLYAEDVVSTEIPSAPNPQVKGKDAVRQKSIAWYNMVEETHGGEISDPIIAGEYFSCTMKFDVTFKESGRTQMEEVCVFRVVDDKIASEQFFYPES